MGGEVDADLCISISPGTYGIFRTGVSPAHRQQMAQNIAYFIVDNK
jgi:hypothetical protein